MKGELNFRASENTGEEYSAISVEENQDRIESERDKNDDTLVFLYDRFKKKVDETIDSPQRYLSRYHYDSKNLVSNLELCPHCRKPTLSTYRKVVVDSAFNYLEEKDAQRGRHVTRNRFAGLTAGLLLISGGLYYLLFHVLSGGGV